MLFKQSHTGNGHSPVNSFAHVINRQQCDLYCGQRFHLDSGGSNRFCRSSACHMGRLGGGSVYGDELHGYPSQGNGVAQGDQVAGLLGTLDARDAGNAQHVAFLGSSSRDERQRRRQHLDTAAGSRDAVGWRLGCDIDHMGLALGVKMGKGLHGKY